MAVGGEDEYNSDINVTPMVDVMLVLLIIFMIVTPLLQQGVSVNLPRDMISPDEDSNDF
jgi:biopolymer transport protein ExbD